MEPYQEAEALAYEGEKWLKSLPVCVECEDPIIFDRCYALNPFDKFNSCLCFECYDEERRRLHNDYLREELDEIMKDKEISISELEQ